jgi:drug/metabolite transporter (DMT)-like permease
MKGADAANLGLFLAMSVTWGGTWVAIKLGIADVPPIFFAALRYAAVAVVLVVIVPGATKAFRDGAAWRTIVTGVLINAGTYSLLFWGMQFIGSGTAGLINLSLMPVGLFVFAVVFADESPRWRHALALALGVAGVAVLFAGKTTISGGGLELLGAAAVVAGTVCYCLGTILSRPLLRALTPIELTAAQALVGTLGLLLLSAALEPLSFETLRALAGWAPLAALAYLALFGTILAYAIYLKLVRDWGAPRAGLYAFISPVIALVLGWLAFGEPIGWREIAGAVLMLAAAGLALMQHTEA